MISSGFLPQRPSSGRGVKTYAHELLDLALLHALLQLALLGIG